MSFKYESSRSDSGFKFKSGTGLNKFEREKDQILNPVIPGFHVRR